MVKALGLSAAIVMLGASCLTPAYAITFDAAIDQCAIVAAEEQNASEREDFQFRGLCLNATAEYITTLNRSGLAPDDMGVHLANYVFELAQLLNQRVCRPESEIPQAIAMTGEASRDPEQAAQIRLISQTVFGCTFTTTAAIPVAATVTGSGTDSNEVQNVAETTPPPAVVPQPPVVNPEPPVVAPEPPVIDPEPPVVDPEPPVIDPETPTGPPASAT